MLLALTLVLVGSPFLRGTDWPQFRGPNSTGVVPAAAIPLDWGEGQNVAWKVAIPGQGWSQPVVVGNTVYVTTAVGDGLEAPMGMEAGVADPRTWKAGATPDVTIEWKVLALDLATGKERWSASAAKGKPKYPIHPSNTWATETPVADASGVVAFFGMSGTLAAFDAAGKALWKAELGVYPTMQGYGTAASPALLDNKVLVQCYTDEKAFVACFDRTSGKELWRVARETAATSWATPLLWHNEKRVELVTSAEKLVTSLDPASGKELWRVTGVIGPNSSSIGADAERIYLGQASPMGNPPLYAIEAGGNGDLTAPAGSSAIKSLAWSQANASPRMSTPVAADGLLYLPLENMLVCRDTGTGEQLYKERVGELVTIMASPIIVGDKLVLLDEEGRSAIVQVGPEFQVVGKGKLDDLFWSTPSVAGDALLLRGAKSLYCVRK